MIRLVALALLLAPLNSATPGPDELAAVRMVYLMPMRSGFDYYLVMHLTRSGIYQVVTDPKKADAIFTDRIGPVLEQRLAEWRDPVAPPEEKKDDAATNEAESGKSASSAAKQEPARVGSATMGGGRGTVFLISRKTGDVLWSAYENPKNSGSNELEKTAERLVKQLRKDLSGEK